MGKKLLAFSRLPTQPPDVFSPVNYRPTERCRTLVFDPMDGNDYAKKLDAVAVQYALGERLPEGFHVIETPEAEGPLVRYIVTNRDGSVRVALHRGDAEGVTIPKGEVKVLGLIFQFIRNLETGERWEFIRGPAHEGSGENVSDRPAVNASLAYDRLR